MWLTTCGARLADDFECSQWAFVHIPKTGGTSVMEMMMRETPAAQLLLDLDACRCGELCDCSDMRHRPDLHHHSARNQNLRIDDNVTSFSVVRNPYDWAVSQFFYGIQEKCPNANCATDICMHSDSPKRDFTSWLAAEDHTKNPFSCDLIANRVKIDDKPVSQRAWLTDELDNIVVKHVIRLEDHDTFRAFSTVDGLVPTLCGDGALDAVNTSDTTTAPHRKRSSHGHRSLYYTDVTCEIVARRFQVDFETFGYDINNCTGLPGSGWPDPVRLP